MIYYHLSMKESLYINLKIWISIIGVFLVWTGEIGERLFFQLRKIGTILIDWSDL